MDSEVSRPSSSASNSSSNSSDNSRSSSPDLADAKEASKSPQANSVGSPQNSTGGRSRLRSRSSNEGVGSPRSQSKSDSDSDSDSSSSDNDNDANTSIGNVKAKSKDSSDRSSVESSPEKRQSTGSRNQSVSPVKSRGSSSVSHEELSDVSDAESEKRVLSFNDSKQSMEDDETNVSLMGETLLEKEAQSDATEHNFLLEDDNSQDVITDLRQKLDQKKSQLKATESCKDISELSVGETPNGKTDPGESLEDLVKTHDEDALDFEAEEGECQEVSKDDENQVTDAEKDTDAEKETEKKKSDKSDGETEDGEELEEGEVSDEDEKRPEETEPKPVCRFYTRGQCTWGMSCRFLHPGVTDKGNYTMFDLVRPVPVQQAGSAGSRASNYVPNAPDYHDFRNERPALHHRPALHYPAAVYPAHHDPRTLIPEGPVVVESAWERGLRTAKEMMRKANKRKEQDMDFEDKKMNLTLSPDELEKDAYYLKDRASPADVVPPYARHSVYQEPPTGIYTPPDRFGRGPPITPYDEVDPYGRTTRYRELPPHRMPQYEDDRRVRPTREVIVQRVEPVGRGDEWNDPWMRSKSPPGRGGSRERSDKRRRDRRSYSSNSSYSTSSSSQSESSSESSRSQTPSDQKQRRYNSNSYKSPPRRHAIRPARSPSPQPRRSRISPTALAHHKIDFKGVNANAFKDLERITPGGMHGSPMANRRTQISPSPVLEKRTSYSPVHKRKKLSATAPKKSANDKPTSKRRHTTSSSGSGSSDSSGSDSDSDSGSSSSESTSRSRGRTPAKRQRLPEKVASDRKAGKKAEPPKKRSPISIEIKKQTTVGTSALTSPTHSNSPEKDSKKSRREELLKQLRAVEDAIAKKRSKLA